MSVSPELAMRAQGVAAQAVKLGKAILAIAGSLQGLIRLEVEALCEDLHLRSLKRIGIT